LRDPTGLVAAVAARVWRYLLLAFVVYLWLFGMLGGSAWAMITWIVTYIVFYWFLEYIRMPTTNV